jgi:hypothetical protein
LRQSEKKPPHIFRLAAAFIVCLIAVERRAENQLPDRFDFVSPNFRDFVSAETNFPVPIAAEVRQRREREWRFFSLLVEISSPTGKTRLCNRIKSALAEESVISCVS